MSALAINDVGLRLGGSDVLRRVSLSVPFGSIAAVLGPPASGKTALLRAIAGLERPHTGAIQLGERVLFDAGRKIDVPPQKRGVGMTFQGFALDPGKTVFQTVLLGARFRGGDTIKVRARIAHALAQVGLVEFAQRPVQRLTQIEQRHIALARALASEPALLLLDEPFAGLDDAARPEALGWLKQFLAQSGTTILLTTTDKTDAFALAQRVAVLNRGAVEQEGTPAELHEQPATAFVASCMGATNRIEGTLVEKDGPRAFIEVMGTRMGGVARTKVAIGDKATGVIRVDRVRPGGGPGANRIAMKLKSQLYLGERWELVFARETLVVRAYASLPLRHEDYHVEFPADALWIY